MKKLIMIYVFIALVVISGQLNAQACCSAGVPLLGSLELPAMPAGHWQFALTYEMNALRDVIDESKKLDDNLRQRTVHSMLLETSVGLSPRWSTSALISFIQQNRTIDSPVPFAAADVLNVGGIGDAVLLLKYNLLPLNIAQQRELSIGFGPKAPLGQHDVRTDQGILLPADMQPGSGAWDAVLWAYFYKGFLPKTRFSLFGNVSARFTGENDLDYKFGNEFITTISTGYRTDGLLDFSLAARYRFVNPDQRYREDIANTGGHWLMLMPSINLKLADAWTMRMAARVPVYRRLNGTQLTTSYRFSVSMNYVISPSQISFDLNRKE